MLPEAGSQQIDQVFPLWRAVCNSEQGKILRGSERWERYKPARMTEIGEWQDVLGHDVNNLDHMRMTDFIIIALVDAQNKAIPGSFSREEKIILRKAALVHDLAEAITGDVNYNLKTDDDEKRELQLMRFILSQPIFEENVSAEEAEQIISILKDRESKLGEVFNLGERLGYSRTSMVTWRKSKLPEYQANGVSENLVWITNNVLLNQIPKLVEKSKKFVLVERMLSFFEDRISDAFENMPAEIFDKYNPEEKEKNKEKFKTARNIWNNYLTTKNN